MRSLAVELIYNTMNSDVILEDIRKCVLKELYENPIYTDLRNKHRDFLKKRLYAQAVILKNKMESFEKKAFEQTEKWYIERHKRMDSVVASMSKDDRNQMNVLANAMYVISDVLDCMITNTNGILSKYGANNTAEFNRLREVMKETTWYVAHFDTLMDNQKASNLFGEASDRLYNLAYNQSSSYVNKLKRYSEQENNKRNEQGNN